MRPEVLREKMPMKNPWVNTPDPDNTTRLRDEEVVIAKSNYRRKKPGVTTRRRQTARPDNSDLHNQKDETNYEQNRGGDRLLFGGWRLRDLLPDKEAG
jgi:hypothetical protein